MSGTIRHLCLTLAMAGVAALLALPQQAVAFSDLAIKMEAAPDPVAPDQPLTYTISVTNLGPDKAHFITVTDNLPFGVELKSISMSGGECARIAGIPFCDLESLAAGETTVVKLTIIAHERPDIGTLVNTARVLAGDNETEPLANNRADTITAIQEDKKQGLQAKKSAEQRPPMPEIPDASELRPVAPAMPEIPDTSELKPVGSTPAMSEMPAAPKGSASGHWLVSWQQDEKANGPLYIRYLEGRFYRGSYSQAENGRMFLVAGENGTISGRWVENRSDKDCGKSYMGSRHWGGVSLKRSDDGKSYRGTWGYCGNNGPYALTIRRRNP